MNTPIDLRSDTVTRPSREMRQAMMDAEVGDDVYGEDPTVNTLQEEVAALLGKEAGLYVPSGSMGNQVSIKVQTQPGDEIIAEKGSHVFNYETAGAAFLASVQVHPVQGVRGIMDGEDIRRAIRPALYYMPTTRLVCIENTHNGAGGVIYTLDTMREISALAHGAGIKVHLDGARLWNACVATGVSPAAFAALADSVSVCLSKGLGAPVGSVIAGSKEFVESARHFRKLYGGGMRQAGVLAAAGLYALHHNMSRLAEDHKNARLLAETVNGAGGCIIDMATVQTNIVVVDISRVHRAPQLLVEEAGKLGVLVSISGSGLLRAVTHLDVSTAQVKHAADVLCTVFAG